MKFKIYSLLSYSAHFSNLRITSDEFNIEIAHSENGLRITIECDLSDDFLRRTEDIVLRDVRAIVNQVIPIINQELLNIKYKKAHVLIDTISILNLYYIFIEDQSVMKGVGYERPFVVGGFPPLEDADNNDEIFIRDYIDAMTSYFKYNLDDCIRRGITSLENYYEYLGIQGIDSTLKFKSGSRPTFMSKLEEHLRVKENFGMPPQVINNAFVTVWISYKIRNAIVHDKYRLQTNERWICNRLIYTLYSIFNARIGAPGLDSMYVVRLGMQFQMVDMMLSWNEFNENYTLSFTDEQIEYICSRFNLTIPEIISNRRFPHDV